MAMSEPSMYWRRVSVHISDCYWFDVCICICVCLQFKKSLYWMYLTL